MLYICDMNNEDYEKIIREGNKTEWHGVNVPEDLLTPLVKFAAEGLSNEIYKLESLIDSLTGVSLERRKRYIKTLKYNLQSMPYSLNNDAYLKKKKRIETQIEEENKKKTTKTKRTTSKKTVTKNKK